MTPYNVINKLKRWKEPRINIPYNFAHVSILVFEIMFLNKKALSSSHNLQHQVPECLQPQHRDPRAPQPLCSHQPCLCSQVSPHLRLCLNKSPPPANETLDSQLLDSQLLPRMYTLPHTCLMMASWLVLRVECTTNIVLNILPPASGLEALKFVLPLVAQKCL